MELLFVENLKMMTRSFLFTEHVSRSLDTHSTEYDPLNPVFAIISKNPFLKIMLAQITQSCTEPDSSKSEEDSAHANTRAVAK